jgi:hypothetical protein
MRGWQKGSAGGLDPHSLFWRLVILGEVLSCCDHLAGLSCWQVEEQEPQVKHIGSRQFWQRKVSVST